ncbi:ImmA/IrrE family metallo-endopeptidase [Pseudobacillus sp. FSL P4-0506]|uniref:ImmA/IrrE family metallo-endopeptidase n=1 Tax=Pseudobacillus sp. FSL P4-0506 TaxID=2921576 RepID=UPI0030F8C48B
MSRIKEVTKELVKKYNSNNPYEIAAAKNIIIMEQNLHESIFGFYKYIRRNKFIFINSNLRQESKFFTCAHELGHSELHPRVNTPFLKRGTLFSVDKIEVEANTFAVELLMPDEKIYEYKYTNLSLCEICKIFGVPKELSHLKTLEGHQKFFVF